jgi:hypothetical protein
LEGTFIIENYPNIFHDIDILKSPVNELSNTDKNEKAGITWLVVPCFIKTRENPNNNISYSLS